MSHTHRPRPTRSRPVLLLAVVAAWFTTGVIVSATSFYVSPAGSDQNNGSETAPFRTIERAQAAVRASNANQSGDITVFLRDGRYELSDTLRFDGSDSGRNGHRVIYRSYPGERARISGGRQVTGWTHYRDGIYRAASPVPAFRQLYINGKRGIRARTPNSGYYRISHWNDGRTITIPVNHAQNWAHLNQVEMVVEKHWYQSRFRIASLTKHGDSATLVPQDPERTVEWNTAWPNREPNQAYFFENSLDFLDQPGEWYLDRAANVIYYMPRPGENPAHIEVIAPQLERLLEIRGAANLHFLGLTFEHSTWTLPDQEGFVGVQGNYYRRANGIGWIPAAIHLESTQRVRLERNVMRNLGGSAIELALGTYQTEILGNAIADVAAGGISVYTWLTNRNPPEHQKSRGDVVRNNFITRVSQDYPGGVAILGTYTDGLIVEHNEVFETPYSGLSIGWGWTSDDTALRGNVVRYNRIHRVMNQLDDGAGIYTLSKQPGTLIEENFIHDLTRSPWAGSYEITALYLDEQSEGITMRNNVVRNLSGVNLFKQNQVRDGANSVYNNGPDIANADAIMANAGLQEAFRDIRALVSEPARQPGPFHGSPAPLPGRIQAEDFDHGGPGVAYHDSTAVNQGGAYRTGEHVDIEPCSDTGGGYNVGYITAGEWLEYTVDIQYTGTYQLLARVASTESGRHFHVAVDGADVTGRLDVPNTGGWQKWTTVRADEIPLETGRRKLRLHFDTSNLNVNWIEAVLVEVERRPFNDHPSAIPGRVWAVEFDRGAPGVTYYDKTPVNQGGAFRPDEPVDIEPASDDEAAYNIGWIADGEWIEYTVDVKTAGLYDVRFRLASEQETGRFRMLFDGKDVTGRLHAPRTGSWQKWTTVTLPQVPLEKGIQIMRLFMEAGEFNISYVDFELVAAPRIETFLEWRKMHFSPEQLEDPSHSGLTADPYGTGVPNLLNYAFRRSPDETSKKNLPSLGRIDLDGASYLTLSYTRSAHATDLSYEVEVSSDMVHWSPADDGVVLLNQQAEEDVETILIRDAEPISASSQRFFRIRVELTP